MKAVSRTKHDLMASEPREIQLEKSNAIASRTSPLKQQTMVCTTKIE
jgi:hypothetical protein